MFVEFEPYALKDARAVLRRGKDASLYLVRHAGMFWNEGEFLKARLTPAFRDRHVHIL